MRIFQVTQSHQMEAYSGQALRETAEGDWRVCCLPAESSCISETADSDLFGNGCVRVMFLDEISTVSGVQVIFHSNWRPLVSRAAFEEGITRARRPITVCCCCRSGPVQNNSERKNNNILIKDNMHAFHLRPFKSSPRPPSLSLCLCEGFRGLNENVRKAHVSAVEQEVCETLIRGELSL